MPVSVQARERRPPSGGPHRGPALERRRSCGKRVVPPVRQASAARRGHGTGHDPRRHLEGSPGDSCHRASARCLRSSSGRVIVQLEVAPGARRSRAGRISPPGPAAEVEDHGRACRNTWWATEISRPSRTSRFHRGRIAEQRRHPFVRRQPQGLIDPSELASQRRFPAPGKPTVRCRVGLELMRITFPFMRPGGEGGPPLRRPGRPAFKRRRRRRK